MPHPPLELNQEEKKLAMDIRSLKDQINGLIDLLHQKRQHLNELPADLKQKLESKLQDIAVLRQKIAEPINTKTEIKKAENDALDNMSKTCEHAAEFIAKGEAHALTLAKHALEEANAILIKIITFDKLPKKSFRPKPKEKTKTGKETVAKPKKPKHRPADDKSKTESTGFSLIELLVVITIIALLAVIAIPAYSQYKVQAQAEQAVQFINSVVEQAVQFANQHGHFPTTNELGINKGPTTTVSGAVNSYTSAGGPGVGQLYVSDISTAAGIPGHSSTPCGMAGFVYGATSSIGQYQPTFACAIAHKNGIVQTKCFYMYTNVQNFQVGRTSLGGATVANAITAPLFIGWNQATTGTDFHNQIISFLTGSTCM